MIISRISAFIIVTILLFLKLRKSTIVRKKLIIILTLALTIIVVSLSMWFPVENLFVTFNTPEQAFNYASAGTIESIDYGKNSCMVNYTQLNGAHSHYLIPKSQNGYKLSKQFDDEFVKNISCKYGDISATKYSGTSDYFFFGTYISHENEIHIADKNGKEIKYTYSDIQGSNDKWIFYHFYLDGYSSQDFIVVDSDKIYLS